MIGLLLQNQSEGLFVIPISARSMLSELTWGRDFHKLETIARGISLHGNLHYGADSSYHGLWLCQMLQGWLVRI